MWKKSKIWLCSEEEEEEEESFTKTNERLDKSFAVLHGLCASLEVFSKERSLPCLVFSKALKSGIDFQAGF